jgi:polysaccharide biosynthesis/export protein
MLPDSILIRFLVVVTFICSCASSFAGQSLPADPNVYVLGPGDEIVLYVSNIAELSNSRAYRLDPQGNIDVPLAGRLVLSGLTLPEAKSAIVQKLKDYAYEPQVSVDIQAFRSQPVSILGAVTEPGVHQLEGQKSLLEVLSMAKGIRSDAGDSLHITRKSEWGAIPLPDSKLDSSGKFYTSDIGLKGLMSGKNPIENISVRPNDVISVPTAELVYVIGAVNRPGGFVLNERKSMSVLQALSLAGGLAKDASAKKGCILRSNGTSKPSEERLNISEVLKGKFDDLNLKGNDILFVPDSTAKNVMGKVAEAALQAATGAAIYRPW